MDSTRQRNIGYVGTYNELSVLDYPHYMCIVACEPQQKFHPRGHAQGDRLRVHANNIQGLWSDTKGKLEVMLETSKANFECRISEFLFRRMTKNSAFPSFVDTACCCCHCCC
uniref:Calpain_III domain-containing protein n=1 Tax=Ascaris lumbricoides TaxID=6252 RepID=A0A0M3HYU4_ASCLU